MINEIGRYLQVPESYLSRTWQNFQENTIDSRIRRVAKVAFTTIYFSSFPVIWGLSVLGKFLSQENIPEAVPVNNTFGVADMAEENPVSNWEVEFNFHPEAMKITPQPITVPDDLESDLSDLEEQCLLRVKNGDEEIRIRHMFHYTKLNDTFPRQNAYAFFKAIEQKILDRDERLSEDDINTVFLELIAGSDKCEPTWYIAAEKAYEKVANGSHDQNVLRLVQEYKEHLFMDPTVLPERLKNADWNIINAARILFGEHYGLGDAAKAEMDLAYIIREGDEANSPLNIIREDMFKETGNNIEYRLREKLKDTSVLIEWIKNKINLENPHLYYDFIDELVQKHHLSIGPEQFFDENYLLTTEGATLMLVEIGVLTRKIQ